jgi:hypothetical protein
METTIQQLRELLNINLREDVVVAPCAVDLRTSPGRILAELNGHLKLKWSKSGQGKFLSFLSCLFT